MIGEIGGRRRIVVFAAHPDDETIGIGSILKRHALQGDTIYLVFTTNGRGEGWFTRRKNQKRYVAKRYGEAIMAAKMLGVARRQILFLGFPDGTLHRYMKYLSRDVEEILGLIRPHRVYVHGVEGGHIDHDATSVAVQTIARKIGFNHVWEWAEYSKDHDLSDATVDFPSNADSRRVVRVRVSWAEKRQLLAAYSSQPAAVRAKSQVEVVRKANCRTLAIEPKGRSVLEASETVHPRKRHKLYARR